MVAGSGMKIESPSTPAPATFPGPSQGLLPCKTAHAASPFEAVSVPTVQEYVPEVKRTSAAQFMGLGPIPSMFVLELELWPILGGRRNP